MYRAARNGTRVEMRQALRDAAIRALADLCLHCIDPDTRDPDTHRDDYDAARRAVETVRAATGDEMRIPRAQLRTIATAAQTRRPPTMSEAALLSELEAWARENAGD